MQFDTKTVVVDENEPEYHFTSPLQQQTLEDMLALDDSMRAKCDKETFGLRGIYHACFRRNTLALKQKEMEDIRQQGTKLSRVLKWYHLVAYGMASTIGAGIFVVAGQVASENAGPAIVLSFLIAAFASLLSAFCYSEYAVRVPLSGSAYTFSYVTLGELIGWFIGWNLTLEYAISASAIARSWADNVASLWLQLFGVNMWSWLYEWDIAGLNTQFCPLTALIIIPCTLILIIGVEEAALFNIFMVVFNVVLITFYILYGALYIDPSNWSPFIPPEFGFAGVFEGAGIVFFSYIGFDAVTTLAGEVKNTRRDLPIGICGTLGSVTTLYVLASMVLTGMVPYQKINPNAGLADAFQSVGAPVASLLVAFGSVTTLSATTFASLLGQPRIFFQMAEDGLFFKIFAKTTKKNVPAIGTIVSGAFALTFAFLLTLGELTDMISIGTLMAFTVVCAGVVIMRHQDAARPHHVPLVMLAFICCCSMSGISIIYGFPYWSWPVYLVPCFLLGISFYIFPVVDIPTGFKTPLVPIIPCVGIYVNIFLILSLDPLALLRVFLWTILGMLIYFGYGIRYSKQGMFERKQQQSTLDGAINAAPAKTWSMENEFSNSFSDIADVDRY